MYVTGFVVLDGPQLTQRLSSPDGPGAVRATMLHELAHLVGLDHVDDPGQLMYDTQVQFDFQAGDLAGLVQLGAGPCMPVLFAGGLTRASLFAQRPPCCRPQPSRPLEWFDCRVTSGRAHVAERCGSA